MSSFEGYHPLLTPLFRFDWLTQFNLKNVADLTGNDLGVTADWVNTTMHDTMNRTALTWGIERRRVHKLVAWGGFSELNLTKHTGQIGFAGKRLPASEQQEIVDRLVHFGHEELQLTELTLIDAGKLDPAVLAAAGFQPHANTWRWRA
ncbi:GNAT family N-acetyltransferase [Levilactobacillus suantsaiihabitans]|uniref:N-acetyltransferase n=1 Tax=Levilactobacillus suantsaiihabitans TaxID=2487722 RepID=A0A4Z0JFD3_9LACO|nr:N-acetyltransferase [Levilactobacillus suantsaiihabitans]TGD20258.1 N-acetyltransferase [Levilactobacillus suantsaiihabitans]